MSVVLPTFTELGWVTGVAEKADLLMAYFIESQYSQTRIYVGNVYSLQLLIQKYPDDENTLQKYIQQQLTALYSAYYDSITCQVTVIAEDSDNPGDLTIRIYIAAVDNDKTYYVARLIETSGTAFKSIQTINN